MKQTKQTTCGNTWGLKREFVNPDKLSTLTATCQRKEMTALFTLIHSSLKTGKGKIHKYLSYALRSWS
jgi:hypothetical protein